MKQAAGPTHDAAKRRLRSAERRGFGARFAGIAMAVVFLVSVLVLLQGYAKRAYGQAPVVLKAVSTVPVNTLFIEPFKGFVDKVAKYSGGRLKVDLRGGPEIVSPFEAHEALTRGVFDIAAAVGGFYAGSVPEVLVGHATVGLTPADMRASGLMAKLDQIHRQKIGATIVGDSTAGPPRSCDFVFLMTRRLSDINDLRGKKIRATGAHAEVVKALGATPVIMPIGEVYVGLERGVVEGAVFPGMGILEQSFHEVAKFMVFPPFLRCFQPILMNATKFDGLPDDHKSVLQRAGLDMENEFRDWWAKTAESERVQLKAKGVQFIELPRDQGEKLQSVAIDATVKFVAGKSPTTARELRELLDKTYAQKRR